MAFTPSKTFLRTFNVVTLALTFYVLIGGLSYGHPMLLNIYKFTAWWGVFCQATAYLATYVAWKENKLDTLVPFTVPKWLSATVDVGIAVYLAAYGHFVYASLAVISQLIELGTRELRAKEIEGPDTLGSAAPGTQATN